MVSISSDSACSTSPMEAGPVLTKTKIPDSQESSTTDYSETTGEAPASLSSPESQDSFRTTQSFEMIEGASSKALAMDSVPDGNQEPSKAKSPGKFSIPLKTVNHGKGNQNHDIPMEESCNMWIVPRTMKYISIPEVLDHIRGYGRIWSIEKGPDAERLNGWTVAFFELSAARKFLHDARRDQGFFLSSRSEKFQVYPSMRHHRDHSDMAGSRCIIVTGDEDKIDPPALVAHFTRHCRYFEYLTIRCRAVSRRRNRVEILFAQFRKQARHAYETLEKHPLEGVESFVYGWDPCAPEPGTSMGSSSGSEVNEDADVESDGGVYSDFSCPEYTDGESDA